MIHFILVIYTFDVRSWPLARRCCPEVVEENMHAIVVLATDSSQDNICILLSYGGIFKGALTSVTSRRHAYDDERRELHVS